MEEVVLFKRTIGKLMWFSWPVNRSQVCLVVTGSPALLGDLGRLILLPLIIRGEDDSPERQSD